MSLLLYIDGKFCFENEAYVSVNDRGYQFGDSVYEVIVYQNGNFLDIHGHLRRLRSSLDRIDFNLNISDEAIKVIMHRLMKKNLISFGSVYIQVSRGSFKRDHSYVNMPLKPILIIIPKKNKEKFNIISAGIKVCTTRDTRWSYPDIKTTQLLPNVIAKSNAVKNGYDEAIFLDNNNFVTEGSSSNFWILDKDRNLVTRYLDGKILAGITRDTILGCASHHNIKVIEKKISLNDIKNCKEAFITSASSFVTPVIQLDDIKINNGKVGNISLLLRKSYLNPIK